jgi:Asp/Glu/hydantoin racemase
VTASEIGIVMLENRIPRPIGDVGNPASFPFPVTLAVCKGASTDQVLEHAAEGLLPSITETAKSLQNEGAAAVTTCCGFLAIHQQELAAALQVPVATSSLLQVPMVLQLLQPHQSVGIITANGKTLGQDHLSAVGIGPELQKRVHVIGIESTNHLYQVLTSDGGKLDQSVAQDEVVAVAQEALSNQPEIGAFVLECTNLPPYSQAIKAATGKPVWDALSLIRWLQFGATGSGPALPPE